MTQVLSDEEKSKDKYFQQIAKVAEAMVEEHGKDFAAGALVLAARWVSENRLGRAENLKH
ncbi:hypothetical protein [Primorskyibacter marinus]|uniref:hypothetical protein n=1 Tax=Primorskyibacter marinus TaxID=1977320 RepID=UPI000E302A04|nr:hypothetical protein [Primorskyibacter marinus]